MSSIFTKIINGEVPSYKVYEDEKCYGFFTIEPHYLGHTLLVPKEEIGYVFDLPDDLYTHIMLVAKNTLGPAIQRATGCKKVGYVVEGFGVPDHFHLHLIPLYNPAGDLDGDKAHEESDEEMKRMQEAIINEL